MRRYLCQVCSWRSNISSSYHGIGEAYKGNGSRTRVCRDDDGVVRLGVAVMRSAMDRSAPGIQNRHCGQLPHLVSIAPSSSTVTLYSTTLCTLLSWSRTTRNTLTLSFPYRAIASTPGSAVDWPVIPHCDRIVSFVEQRRMFSERSGLTSKVY
jgi:hypothetical protein